MLSRLVACAILALVAAAAHAQDLFSHSKAEGIIELTQSNWDAEVVRGEHTVLVKYYAPWCGYCKQLAPEFKKAAKKLRGLVKVGTVNCDQEKLLCSQANIQGFPVVKAYYTNARSRKRINAEFQAERTAKNLVSFATGRMPNFVKPIGRSGDMALNEFYDLENATLPKALVVRAPSAGKKATPPLLKALAIDLHYRMVFGAYSAPTKDAYTDFVPPANGTELVVIKPNGELVRYDGAMKFFALQPWLAQYASDKKVTRRKKIKSKTKPAAASEQTPVPTQNGDDDKQKKDKKQKKKKPNRPTHDEL